MLLSKLENILEEEDTSMFIAKLSVIKMEVENHLPKKALKDYTEARDKIIVD